MDSLKSIVQDTYASIYSFLTKHKWAKYLAIFGAIYIAREMNFRLWRRYKRLPPGPTRSPFVDIIVSRILYDNNRRMLDLPAKYGPIVHKPGLAFDTVVISDSKLVKQLFVANLDRLSSVDRDKVSYYHSIWSVGPDKQHQSWPLLFINGKTWTERRKHAQSNLFRTMTINMYNK